MKALVLELEDGRIAALREDGEIVTARKEWPVGEYIELDDADLELPENVVRLPVKKRRWVQAVIAASLAFVLLTGSYTYTTAWACSYVSVETEKASVELAVNRLGRVIEVKALNEDSEELAETLTAELRHKPVEEALEQTMEHFREEGRIAEDETILAGVTDKNENRAADLTEKLERAIGQQNELHTVEVTPEQREEAKNQDMGGGRFVWEQRASEPQPGNTPAPEMTEERAEPPQTANAVPEEKPEERQEYQQSQEQTPPARPDSNEEPPAQPAQPGKGEQTAGTVPEQSPQLPQQGSESTPTAPEERQEPQQSAPQSQPQLEQPQQPADGNPTQQQMPGNDSGFGGGKFGQQQGMNVQPEGNGPMSGQQSGGDRR